MNFGNNIIFSFPINRYTVLSRFPIFEFSILFCVYFILQEMSSLKFWESGKKIICVGRNYASHAKGTRGVLVILKLIRFKS